MCILRISAQVPARKARGIPVNQTVNFSAMTSALAPSAHRHTATPFAMVEPLTCTLYIALPTVLSQASRGIPTPQLAVTRNVTCALAVFIACCTVGRPGCRHIWDIDRRFSRTRHIHPCCCHLSVCPWVWSFGSNS
ncbi:hypothetical protein ACOMHN_018838 [Nucella lapillus]